MRKVGFDEYLEFAGTRKELEVESSRVKLEPIEVKRIHPSPEELTDVSTTVWSFPKRGSWATHRGDYRGNWPPQMVRALILMFTEPGDTVLDPMVGSGTTCIEAVLLGRNCVGVDINYYAIMLTLHRIYWLRKHLERLQGSGSHRFGTIMEESGKSMGGVTVDEMLKARIEVYHGDARNLDKIQDESIDLVAMHPPYSSIIKYSKSRVAGDLSAARSLEEYLAMMSQVVSESFRVLRPGGHLGILVGDTRVHRHYVPITYYVLDTLLKTGFILKEEVVKIQHRMKATRERWAKLRERDFLLIYHEKLFILRKPKNENEYKKYRHSSARISG
ncbi:MAG: DNA methylase [Desulfurococcales archaeon]|nr:DNA methylase [Desulfurococcales archaeon]